MVGATEVRGQSGAAPSGTASARQTIDEAVKAEAAGRKREAIEGYKRAYALSGDATLLFRLGELSREVGETSAAERFYRAYLARDKRGTHREAAERAVRALELEELATAAPNRPASPPPAPPAAGEARSRAAPPARPPAAAAPTSAGVERASSPILDPLVNPPAPEGRGSGTTASAMATATAPSPTSPPLPRWVPWAGLAVTLALGAGAVYSGLAASQRYDELSSSCGQTAAGCPQGDIDKLKSRVLAANLLWAAAGLGALATGVTVYVNTRESGVSGVWSF